MDGGGGLLLTPFPSEAVAFWEREKRGGLSAQVNFFFLLPFWGSRKKKGSTSRRDLGGWVPEVESQPCGCFGTIWGSFCDLFGSFCDLFGVIL